MSATDKALRSGDLARLAGVSSDTVRHYERIGILPEALRTSSGYRMYSHDAAERVRLVRRALQIGFTLTELAEILQTRDRGGAPCQRVLDLTEAKLRSLEEQIQELRRTQRYMRQLVRQWRLQLTQLPPGKKAMLLHSLADKPMPAARPGAHNFKRRKQT
ncbi:MAG TPA: heavy metal-responsive transcriptional regulator [Candidatus Sulfotelmatobacter sp.]|nr:heavy metal-responsive transcriptional regulator [Candidatus Sulfotelmatobacter sp.]